MNQMVHLAVTASQPRDRLLVAAVEQAMRGGIADLGLRELAAAIGTSHRRLLYHFGSREGLLVAIARAVEEAERARFLSWGMGMALDGPGSLSRRGSLPSLSALSGRYLGPGVWVYAGGVPDR